MAPPPPRRRRAATTAACAAATLLLATVALASFPQPAQAQTASSWLQVFNMLLKPRQCANGKVLAVCRRDPCAVTTCPQGFRCKADYCGACSGLCEADDQADEVDRARAAAAPTCELTGQPGKKAVRPTCSTPMCTYMQCGTGMACVNDFCGGCTGTCVNSTDTMGGFALFCLGLLWRRARGGLSHLVLSSPVAWTLSPHQQKTPAPKPPLKK
jgi:hypothetical protein